VRDRYSWQDSKTETSYRSTSPDHLGWWAAAAMLVSILLHVVVFFALDRVKFGIEGENEIVTERVVVRSDTQPLPQEFTPAPPPEDIPPVPNDLGKLVDDVDILEAIKNQEIDLKPQVVDPEYAVKMSPTPAASGDLDGLELNVSSGIDIDSNLPELGRAPSELRPAASGQITVDPGSMRADDSNLTRFTEDLIKKGAGGKVANGSLDGVATLDDLIGLDANALMGKKTMLPSDLLFEFNRAELRESAKFGLQKLGLLLDSNPTMYCWIEGHTDLIGNDSANLELSLKRAEAVKQYLVASMRMDADKIITRGFGEFEPIVTEGDQIAQSPNRRVEIKMRKTPPTQDQLKIAPPKAPTVAEEMPPAPLKAAMVEEMPPATPQPMPAPAPAPPTAKPVPEPAPPKATLVKPNPQKAIPVEVIPQPAPMPPKAKPINEPPPRQVPRALPVEAEPTMPAPAPARAIPVEPEVPRAAPVAE